MRKIKERETQILQLLSDGSLGEKSSYSAYRDDIKLFLARHEQLEPMTKNEQVVETFKNQHESVVSMPIEANWGEQTGTGRQLLPAIGFTDGFFYARLKKQSL